MSPTRSTARAGFTMVELLIAMTLLVVLSAGIFAVFNTQSRSFRNNANRFDLAQNMRSAVELSERVTRTMGAGVAGAQPSLVYGGNSVLAFNSDYIERDTVDMRWAAYFNPDVPADEAIAWRVAAATVIPTTGFTYPTTNFRQANGALSPAETYILWLSSDSATVRNDDFILWQRVNAGTPEILARSLLAPTGSRPFFEYLLQRTLPTGDTLITASGTLLPLIRRPTADATNAADSASFSRPDSVRAVRFRFRVTNGRAGTEEVIRELETTIEVPNNGIPVPSVCGRRPLAPGGLTLVDPGTGDGRLTVEWEDSPDQDAGEVDVRQYIIWRRLSTDPDFGEPLLVVRSEAGLEDYTTDITDNVPGTAYVFGVAAQDCTPSMSNIVTRTITMSTP